MQFDTIPTQEQYVNGAISKWRGDLFYVLVSESGVKIGSFLAE